MRLSTRYRSRSLALAQGLVAAPATSEVPAQAPRINGRPTDSTKWLSLQRRSGAGPFPALHFAGLSRGTILLASLARRDGNGNKGVSAYQPQWQWLAANSAILSPRIFSRLSLVTRLAVEHKKGSPRPNGSPAANPKSTAQANFKLVQSYGGYTAVLCRAAKIIHHAAHFDDAL